MKIKEFFKPNIWKILVSILAIVICYLISLQILNVDCISLLCEPCGLNENGVSLYKSDCCDCYPNYQIYQDLIIILTLGILIYLISCLIIFIFNKFRKKSIK